MVVNSTNVGDSTVETMDLTGGELCLDFVNTLSNRAVGPPRERLVGYGDLLTWSVRTESLSTEAAKRLRGASSGDPKAAAATLERARALREAIYRLFVEAAPSRADLTLVGEEAAAACAERRLVAGSDGYDLVWPGTARLDRPLWPVALSAADLLTSDDRVRVRECAAEDCNWLFLDMSRNRSRRWCDMAVCGNRAKARRFLEKQRRAVGRG